ncbi:hypothetical protein ACKF11_11555 [Methylobacillus sp. Pita2]|uniref:hypothetical protein n=1 Tax=Methylobacillus sp. Pita2 TaxID=3383245 RepID=UPI0038B4F14E
MSTDDQQKKTTDAAVDFERTVYTAMIQALRHGVRPCIVIDNLNHHAKVVHDTCKIYKDVTGHEAMWP